MENSKKGLLLGVKSAVISSSCCTIPLALVVLFGLAGAGSWTAALKIPKYKTVFVAFGTMFLAISTYLAIKKRCGGTCTIQDVKSQKTMILMSLVSYILLTLLVIYLILPIVAELLFS